ncbi:basic salivary proline-rich protein 4-like [Falco naumanni]|uniref:basic salivary proline-rich protein 4-like n=1 Tax=Falco naumanni TaxID=148594 RepID=UPI001ADE1EC7|nr:basic salivary proline-rich protein 4-like [Falco naumanni]
MWRRRAPQPAARYPVSPPAVRGDAQPVRRPAAGGLPCRKAGPPPPPEKQPLPGGARRPTAPAPPPGEQSAARPQGLRCARGRPSAGLGRGKRLSRRGYSPGCGAPGARAGRTPAAERVDAGRSLDPPAPARLRRLLSAASHRLAGPAADPGNGNGGGSGPSPVGKETASTARCRHHPRSAALASAPPPPPLTVRGAEPRYQRPFRGAAAAAARDAAGPRDGDARPHPGGDNAPPPPR